MKEQGSTTLITEALILILVVLTGFAAIQLLFSKAEDKMEETTTLGECGNVLDCPPSTK